MVKITNIISEKGSERIIRKAFELAKAKKVNQIHLFHKANILKTTSGLFLEIAKKVAKDYEIELIPLIIDNALMQMVKYPEQFKIIVTTNLFGDLVSDLAAGANIGDDFAVFEAVHGTAPDITGKGIANPSSLMLSAAMMLDYLGFSQESKLLKDSIYELINEGICTGDLGGSENTKSFTDNLLTRINEKKV